jgi:hypothetical protein
MYWVREAPPPANEQSSTVDSIEDLYCRSSSQFKPLGVCQRASSRRRFFWIPKRERKRVVPFDQACDIICRVALLLTRTFTGESQNLNSNLNLSG